MHRMSRCLARDSRFADGQILVHFICAGFAVEQMLVCAPNGHGMCFSGDNSILRCDGSLLLPLDEWNTRPSNRWCSLIWSMKKKCPLSRFHLFVLLGTDSQGFYRQRWLKCFALASVSRQSLILELDTASSNILIKQFLLFNYTHTHTKPNCSKVIQ